MKNPMTVLDMVHGLLADTDRMLQKRAQEAPSEQKENIFSEEDKKEEKENDEKEEKDEAKTAASKQQSMLKIASACEFLADNLHSIVDNRSPTEKLAEHVLLQKALMKKMGGEAVSPTVPAGEYPRREAADAPGESLDAGESGQATDVNVPDLNPEPTEHARPTDAGNSMPTNVAMMMPEQPEDVLKQSSSMAFERAVHAVKNVAKKAPKEGLKDLIKNNPIKSALLGAAGVGTVGATGYGAHKLLKKKEAQAIIKHANVGNIPTSFAKSLLKTALEVSSDEADGLNSSISGGKTPLLQQSSGVSPAQSQGSTVGENTPRETAPVTGEGAGRSLIDSNESAIKFTKRQAKLPQINAMKEVLTEPAMSSAHDKTLNESLVNTSEAGVKIAATKALLKKIAKASPAGNEMVKALLKQAQGEMAAAPGAAQAAMAPPVQAGVPMQAAPMQGEVPVDAAAQQQGATGLSPEEIAAAQQLLQSGASGAMPQGAAGVPAPGQMLAGQ